MSHDELMSEMPDPGRSQQSIPRPLRQSSRPNPAFGPAPSPALQSVSPLRQVHAALPARVEGPVFSGVSGILAAWGTLGAGFLFPSTFLMAVAGGNAPASLPGFSPTRPAVAGTRAAFVPAIPDLGASLALAAGIYQKADGTVPLFRFWLYAIKGAKLFILFALVFVGSQLDVRLSISSILSFAFLFPVWLAILYRLNHRVRKLSRSDR